MMSVGDWFLGSGPDRGQSPVEWGEIPFVCSSIRPSIPPSGWPSNPTGWPSDPVDWPSDPPSWPSNPSSQPSDPSSRASDPSSWPSGSEGQPAGSEGQPAGSEGQPEGGGWMDGQTDGRTDGRADGRTMRGVESWSTPLKRGVIRKRSDGLCIFLCGGFHVFMFSCGES